AEDQGQSDQRQTAERRLQKKRDEMIIPPSFVSILSKEERRLPGARQRQELPQVGEPGPEPERAEEIDWRNDQGGKERYLKEGGGRAEDPNTRTLPSLQGAEKGRERDQECNEWNQQDGRKFTDQGDAERDTRAGQQRPRANASMFPEQIDGQHDEEGAADIGRDQRGVRDQVRLEGGQRHGDDRRVRAPQAMSPPADQPDQKGTEDQVG